MGKCSICKNKVLYSESDGKACGDPIVTSLLFKLCRNCKKKAVHRLGIKPSSKDIKELYATVNGLLTSAEVRKIRKKLNLTQKEAARICGGGPNAFSRYERGEITPVRATSNLLRLLDKYPKELQYLLQFCN